jgi:hypothetical protein
VIDEQLSTLVHHGFHVAVIRAKYERLRDELARWEDLAPATPFDA